MAIMAQSITRSFFYKSGPKQNYTGMSASKDDRLAPRNLSMKDKDARSGRSLLILEKQPFLRDLLR